MPPKRKAVAPSPTTQALTKRDALVERGHTGLRISSGRVWEDFDRSLRGPQAVKLYDEMRRNEATLGAVLNAMKLVLRGVSDQVVAASGELGAEEAAEFVRQCMEDMSHTWSDLKTEILTMVVFGWAWFEVCYKLRQGESGEFPSQYDDGKVGWRKIALRGQESLDRWDMDDHGGIRALIQKPNTYANTGIFASQPIPISKSILFRTEREKNNPEGYSFLRNAVRPYMIKKGLEDIETIGYSRDLTGIPVVHYPSGGSDDDFNLAKDIVEKMEVDEQAGLAFEWLGSEDYQNWKIELLSAPGGGKASDLNNAIQRVSGEISLVFLAQFIRQGQQRVGSYAMVKEHKDLWHLGLSAILDNIQETTNRFLVPPLMRLNGIPKEFWPSIQHDPIAEADIQGIASFANSLSQAGLLTYDRELENSLRRQGDLPELAEEEPEELGMNERAFRWAAEYLNRSKT